MFVLCGLRSFEQGWGLTTFLGLLDTAGRRTARSCKPPPTMKSFLREENRAAAIIR